MKLENLQEENTLKRKKQTSDNLLEENIKTYDMMMEEKMKEKNGLEVCPYY